MPIDAHILARAAAAERGCNRLTAVQEVVGHRVCLQTMAGDTPVWTEPYDFWGRTAAEARAEADRIALASPGTRVCKGVHPLVARCLPATRPI